jgi:hypothetical protein
MLAQMALDREGLVGNPPGAPPAALHAVRELVVALQLRVQPLRHRF